MERTNGTLDTIRALRSTHGNFSDREVSEEDLQTVLDAAARAATASAQQSYSIVVVEERAAMRKLTGYAGSKALVFCADGTRFDAVARRLGRGGGEAPGMEALITWSIDALLAAQTACIAARALGIDSLFTNGIGRTGVEAAFHSLGLPERGCYPLITLVLGYADRGEDNRKGRYHGKGLVHRGGKYRAAEGAELDAMIAEYDDPARKLAMNPDFRAQGFAHYHDWFFGKWLAGFPAGGSDAFAARLRKSGFLE